MSEITRTNIVGRQTGRTSSMLHRAIADALSGQTVMVVAAGPRMALMMLEQTAKMEKPSGISKAQCRLDYFKGSITFRVHSRLQALEKGWRGPIFIDHFVYETEITRENSNV